jgi:hypothetical protein
LKVNSRDKRRVGAKVVLGALVFVVLLVSTGWAAGAGPGTLAAAGKVATDAAAGVSAAAQAMAAASGATSIGVRSPTTLYSPGTTAAAGVRVDVTGSIDPGQCALCHRVIALSKNPDLMFSHGFHLTVVCSDCHWQYPHTPTGTIRPTMQSCFNCHGVGHGPQGMVAKSACRTCHPPSFVLRPRSHGRDWSGKPHADAWKKPGSLCALCHTQAECKSCHDARHIRTPFPYALAPYVPELPATMPPAPFTVNPDAPGSREQCSGCHQDLDRFSRTGREAGRIILSHSSHLKRGFLCVACHARSPHRPDGIARPNMRTCYACHGVSHGRQGLIASAACDVCHPKSFDLLPVGHRPASTWTVSHGPKAGQDLSYCYMCHSMSFCVPCHNGKQKVQPAVLAALEASGAVDSTGPLAGMVVPKDHHTQQWQAQHGKDFTAKGESCSPCHTGDFCVQCHKSPLPHPPNWQADHGSVARRVGRADCDVCHADRSACQSCHHVSVGDTRLEQKVCARCHPDALLPWRSITDKGMVVHAVHWKKKYRCLQCHFGFSQEVRARDQQHSYSFDICRQCHGALDPIRRSVIATPPVGAALCRACHPNLLL